MKKDEISMEKMCDTSTKSCGHGKSKIIIILAIVVIIGGLACWKIFSGKGLDLNKLGSTSGDTVAQAGQASLSEIKEVMAKISKHMVLPTDEVPQMATISNVEEMAKQQVFFVDAQNGDKLLVFMTAKKAVIYSPTKDLVVNVGPVFMDQTTAPGETAAQGDQSPVSTKATAPTSSTPAPKVTAPTKK